MTGPIENTNFALLLNFTKYKYNLLDGTDEASNAEVG